MVWAPPSVATFKARFPEFASVEDATVQVFMDEAIMEVNDTWIEEYRTPGVLHLTAHLLASQGLGVSTPGDSGASVTGGVKRRTVGDVTTEFNGISSGGGSGLVGTYSTTRYGQRYLEMKRINFPAVLAV